MRKLPQAMNNAAIFNVLETTKSNIYRWGKRNRVTFDENKQGMAILHPLAGEGEDFNFLGTTVDAKLTMETNIRKLTQRIRPKVQALTRTKSYYGLAGSLEQYKTHIWGYAEYHGGAMLHACTTVLSKLC